MTSSWSLFSNWLLRSQSAAKWLNLMVYHRNSGIAGKCYSPNKKSVTLFQEIPASHRPMHILRQFSESFKSISSYHTDGFFTIYTEKHTSSQFGKCKWAKSRTCKFNPELILGRKFLFETFQPGNQGYLSRCHVLTVYHNNFLKI